MKIKYSILDRLAKTTKKELDFFLYVARFQDDYGHIKGVYHAEVCKNTGMCKQTFYSAMYALQTKGIIRYQKLTDSDYDIWILDNDFSYPDAVREGYVMLNRELFRSKSFRSLKAKEKYLLLDLMRITHSNRGIYSIRRNHFYEKYGKILGTSMRIIRYYLQNLRRYFEVQLKNGVYHIQYKVSKFAKSVETAAGQVRKHDAKVLLRRSGYDYNDPKEVKEIEELLKQYKKKAKERGVEISRVLYQVLVATRNELGGIFQIKRIHMLLKECLAS